MSTVYGPTKSPFGANQDLDKLTAQIEGGEVPVNLATAQKVMNLVEADGRITTEESQTLDKVWTAALAAKPGKSGATPYGRDLLLNFTKVARARLFATQANNATSPATLLMSAWSWGTIDTRPSYVAIDKSPLTGKTTDTASLQATKTTLDEHAGKWPLIRLVEANFPEAIADPGHSHKAPTLHADVEAEYQTLRADILAGRVDENDPFAPMKTFLENR